MKEQTGLWIENSILFSDLSAVEKMILADVVALSSGANFYFKKNQTIADLLRVSLRTVNYSIKSLVDRKLIQSKVCYPYGSFKKSRILIPCRTCIDKIGEFKRAECD